MPKVIKYGCEWNTGDPVAIELACIKNGGYWVLPKSGAKVGLGLAHHIKAFAKLVWPWFYWHRWNEMILPEFCKGGRIAVFGCSSSQKTGIASLFGLAMYCAFPRGTTVLVSTTTREMLNMRIWGEMKMLWRRARERYPAMPGNLIDSAQMITTDGKEVEGREFRDGIVGRPVKKGGEWVGLGDFVGIKNDRIIVIGDEYHLMPDAVGRSMANLAANENCTFISLGNLNDLNTPLGQEAEPKNGWDSLMDSEKARVYETRWYNGRAIQLPGVDSPNLDYPEGGEPFKKLIGRRYLKECEQNYGKDTPLYNMFAAGKIPRSTLENRVISKQICLKYHAFEEITWSHKPITKLYCQDISYTADHGDRTVGMPMAFGEDNEGVMRLACLERPHIFTPSDRKPGSIEDQIAEETKQECERLAIPAARIFYDGTGRSSYTAALMRAMGTEVNPIEFGGTATRRENFLNRKYSETKGSKMKGDLLSCEEVFVKMVTELWFAWRALIEADQLRGMSEEIAKEGYLRLWVLADKGRIEVESKKDMKLRLGRSPDLADCFVGETLVSTINGKKRIDSIQLGDEIETPFGFSPVVKIHVSEVYEITTTTFSNGESLKGKGKHKVFTWDSGWVRMDSLSIDNEIESIHNIAAWKFLSSLFTRDESTVFKHLVDIIKTKTGALSRRDFYIELFGQNAMGLFRKVCASITRMVIGKITTWIISSLCQSINTPEITPGKDIKEILKLLKNGGLLELSPQFTGINQRKAGSGIKGIPSIPGLFENRKRLAAFNVEKILKHSFQPRQSYAQKAAEESTTEKAREQKGSVWYALKNLILFFTKKQSIAPVTVQRSQLLESKKVYNLTLLDHNVYYANGILVQNCLVCGIEGARRLGFPLGTLTQVVKPPRSRWLSDLTKQFNDSMRKQELTYS